MEDAARYFLDSPINTKILKELIRRRVDEEEQEEEQEEEGEEDEKKEKETCGGGSERAREHLLSTCIPASEYTGPSKTSRNLTVSSLLEKKNSELGVSQSVRQSVSQKARQSVS